ncbi:MAG: GTP cyclohydrolase II [Acidimicrobiales bacterium]
MVSFRNQPTDHDVDGTIRAGSAQIPTEHGHFVAHAYLDDAGREHIAYVSGDVSRASPLVRVHSECLTGDVLGSLRCDCGSQLTQALEQIAAADAGILVYLRGHEGRGIGLGHKLQAYELQDAGLDTVDANHELGFPADARTYHIAATILIDLGATRIRLLTNNASKSVGLADHGIEVTEMIPLPGVATEHNARYLETKRTRMAHDLEPLHE